MGVDSPITQSAHYSPPGRIGQPIAKPLEQLQIFFKKELAKVRGAL
jgi:hypothetical protein